MSATITSDVWAQAGVDVVAASTGDTLFAQAWL